MSAVGMAERMQAHLAALPGDVGCRHLARERDRISARLLIDLQLVKPILSRVPRCTDHGCPWLTSCAHWEDFEPEASGAKSGVKYRRTSDGEAAAANAPIIQEAVLALPAARDVLALLEAGPSTIFTLNSHFMDRARQAARTGENPDSVGMSRVKLAAVLAVLAEFGLIERGEDSVTYVRRLGQDKATGAPLAKSDISQRD